MSDQTPLDNPDTAGQEGPAIGQDEWVARHGERRSGRAGRLGQIEEDPVEPYLLDAFVDVAHLDRERLIAQRPPRRFLRDAIDRARGGMDTGVRGGSERIAQNNRDSQRVFEAIQRDDADWLALVTEDWALEPSA